MTDTPKAPDRRKLLATGGKTALLLSLPAALAACLQVEDNATRNVSGVTQIQLRTGLNCWQGQCFRYNRVASVPGREPVRIPDDVEIIDGFVTEEGFARILAEARRAPWQSVGGGNDVAGGGGFGGGSNCGGGSGN